MYSYSVFGSDVAKPASEGRPNSFLRPLLPPPFPPPLPLILMKVEKYESQFEISLWIVLHYFFLVVLGRYIVSNIYIHR